MAENIDLAYVSQFQSDVITLSQQKQSILRPLVMNGTQKAEVKFYERIGKATATKKTARHGDTPLHDVEHSRRAVTLEDYEFNRLFDKEDDEKVLIDVTNAYTQAGAMAMARGTDDEIASAMVGTAFGGKGGKDNVALPITQKLVAHTNAAPGTPTKMNLDTLIRIKGIFEVNEVDDSEEIFISMGNNQLQALLLDQKISSADYANVKALVEGRIDTFMGMKFVKFQRWGKTSMRYDANGNVVASGGTALNNVDRVVAWVKSGVVLSTAREPVARIDERADKSYSKQIYFSMGIGAARLEEEKVVEVAAALT